MSQDDYVSLCLMAVAAARQAGASGHLRHDATQLSASASSEPLLNFRCPICSKAFASYQALGGHKASHRKPTAAAPAPNEGTKMPPFPQTEDVEPSAPGGGSRRHVCTVCRRVFATGQALGGHKRFHYLHGPFVPASLPSAEGSCAAGFDLNAVPIMAPEIAFARVRRRGEEEEEEVQSPSLPAKKLRRL